MDVDEGGHLHREAVEEGQDREPVDPDQELAGLDHDQGLKRGEENRGTPLHLLIELASFPKKKSKGKVVTVGINVPVGTCGQIRQ